MSTNHINTNCVICQTKLTGHQTMYCSSKCKSKTISKQTKYNNYIKQQHRGIIRKVFFVQQLGGKCQKCGYNENLSALAFHHTNPKDKEFNVDMRTMSNLKFSKLQEEVSKCELLCHNCHSEFHNTKKKFILKHYHQITLEEAQDIQKEYYKSPQKLCLGCSNIISNNSISGLCNECYKHQPRPHRRKVERPPKEILLEEIKTNTMVALGKKYGVSDNAVKKWVKYYNNS